MALRLLLLTFIWGDIHIDLPGSVDTLTRTFCPLTVKTPTEHGFLTLSLRGTSVIVHKCKGSNLTLLEPDPITILHAFVFLGRETLASSSVPATGMFEDRLIVDNDGRVTLADLIPDDLGRYQVEYQMAENKYTYNISLVIKEPPKTTNEKLFVMKYALPNRNSIRLNCGTFTTLGFPPASAVWKDPAGRTLSSDGFEDQYFYLDLPADTADSGDYCCQLDCRAPDFCCLDDQSPLRSCAEVRVQTDKKVEVTTDERVSLANVSQTMAYLVHRQARCDQLDAYITKVETLEVDMLKGIENMRNITRDIQIHLERETNHKLLNFQLQMDFNMSRAMDSFTVYHQQLMTTVSDKLEALGIKLSKNLSDVYNVSAIADSRLEANMSQCEVRLSTLEKKLLAVDERLNKLVTKTSHSMDAIPSNVSATSKATSDGRCPEKREFLWFKESCLKASSFRLNYTSAKALCMRESAHLFDIKSPALDEERVRFAVKQAGISVPNQTYSYIWLGGNDLEAEGDYRWSDGAPLSFFSDLWQLGEPNDGGAKKENCVELRLNLHKFVLNDVSCSNTLPFICQYD